MTSKLFLAVPLVGALAGAGAVRAAETKVIRGAQASGPMTPVIIGVDLRDLPLAKEWEPGDPIKEIPRRFYPEPNDPVRPVTREGTGPSPLLALQEGAGNTGFTPPAILNFDAQNFTGVNPPDTVGDVGPNHYIQMINHSSGSSFIVYSKTGAVLAGPIILDTLGAPAPCNAGLGDPIVLWDPMANRWLLSEFSSSGNRLCVYISQTADPVSGGWFAYAFQAPSFPDYPHYAVWPDAYYVGTNEGNAPPAYALDRVRMLAGQPATSQRLTAPGLPGFGFEMLMPADLDGPTAPPAGAPAVFLRHRDDEGHSPPGDPTRDFIELFEFHVDWVTPSNSTLTGPISIPVAEFSSDICDLNSFNCIVQPSGPLLDPLHQMFMYRAQYRNFGTHQTITGNFSEDADGDGGGDPLQRAAPRWLELRKTTGGWVLQQEGTFSPDTTSRWNGASAMDESGNFAVVYNVASSSVFPGVRVAGRLVSDPPGTFRTEAVVVPGVVSNASGRYGDYAALSVDPADECTFWYTGMYNPTAQWRTRIATFRFDACGGPGFSVVANPGSLTINRGGSASTVITLTSTGGFAGSVDLTATGLPAGVTVSFNPATVVLTDGGSANSTATFVVGAAAPTGPASVSINGTSGALVRTGTVSLTINAGGGAQSAGFDPTLQAPKCTTVGSSCDSGTLLTGRDGRGPEPNQPNTIGDSCPDGTAGTFHVEESIDRIQVTSADGTNFAPSKLANIQVTVWAASLADALDVYYTANANSPDWVYVGTASPAGLGAQVLQLSYRLPGGPLQAVRARFRYHGKPAVCGRLPWDDHDDLVFAVDNGVPPPDNAAAFDAGLQAPRCATTGRSCDTGPAAVLGRDGKGPEPNQPNTIADSCADGTSGTFHRDESLDRLSVRTTSGGPLADGVTIQFDVVVYASREFGADRLDLYFAPNAAAPSWTLLTTLTPAHAGQQTLTHSFTLPPGTLPAVRARFRYGGTQAPCGTGAYDDVDDLVFAVP
jgi:hypothetical protein